MSMPAELPAQASDGGNVVKLPTKIEPDGLGYVWRTGRGGLVFRADRIQKHFGNDLKAEIRVTLNDNKHVHMNNWVVTRHSDREALAKALIGSPAVRGWGVLDDWGWKEIVQQFCDGVVIKRRASIRRFTTEPAPKQHVQYLVEKLVIKGRRPNMIFSPGGMGKSTFVCGLCVAIATRRGVGDLTVLADDIVPMYFDWEDDFPEFNDKANSVARGYGIEVPRIQYREMTGAVPDAIYDMAKEMSDAGANFGVIDSMSAAFGTVSQGRGWDAVAQDAFDALALVPDVTWLLLGHVPKANLSDLAGAVLGSIQLMNRSATAWEIRTEQEPDSDTVHMKLHHAKWNKTRKHAVLGMRMEFDEEAVRFESESAETIPANLVDRMTEALIGGVHMQVADLAKKLGSPPSSIRTAKTRAPHRFVSDQRGEIRLNSSWDGAAEDGGESGGGDLPFDGDEAITEGDADDLPG